MKGFREFLEESKESKITDWISKKFPTNKVEEMLAGEINDLFDTEADEEDMEEYVGEPEEWYYSTGKASQTAEDNVAYDIMKQAEKATNIKDYDEDAILEFIKKKYDILSTDWG